MAKKVLHILSSDRYSGAENVAYQIISSFKNDTDFELLYCSPDGSIRESLYERNIRFVPLKNWSLNELRNEIKSIKPDIIHAHDMKASFYSSLVCGRIPLISHVHNNNYDTRSVSIKSLLYSISAMKAKHIFWVSESAYYGFVFHKSFRNKSSILYNCVDSNEINKKAENDTTQYPYDIVYVGRLTYPKNPERLISVLGKIIVNDTKVQAAIIGTGELEESVKNEISQRGLGQNIKLLGFCNNPYKIMKSAKLMIMTSRFEGLPMCALEAMALDLPIVSTPTDGLKELIIDGTSGFLSNNDDELVSYSIKILNSKELRDNLKNGIRNTTKQFFDISSYKSKIEELYRKL